MDRQGEFFWVWSFLKEGSQARIRISQSPDGVNWHPHSEFLPPRGRVPNGLYPLGQDWFLVDFLEPMTLGQEASLLALAKRDRNGMLQIESLVDMGLKQGLLTARPPTKGWSLTEVMEVSAIRPVYRRIHPDFVARTPDALVLASGYTGFLWVVRMRDSGPFVRRVDLFPGVTEDVLAKGMDLEWGVLGLQPTPDGRVLAATRSEQAVLHGRKVEPSSPLKTLANFKDAVFMDARGKSIKASLETFPELQWWSLDPETGGIRKEETPLNTPARFPDIATAARFRFRPKTNGDLLLFDE